MIIAGGLVDATRHKYTDEIVEFDTVDGSIRVLPWKLDAPTARAVALVFEGSLHVLGGETCRAFGPGDCTPLNTTVIINLSTGRTERVASPRLGEVSKFELDDGTLLLFPSEGGIIHSYDPRDREFGVWASEASIIPATERIPLAWDGEPCFAGGVSAAQPAHSEVYCVDLAPKRVLRMRDLPLPQGSGIAVGADPVYLVGGVGACGVCGQIQEIHSLEDEGTKPAPLGAGNVLLASGLALALAAASRRLRP